MRFLRVYGSPYFALGVMYFGGPWGNHPSCRAALTGAIGTLDIKYTEPMSAKADNQTAVPKPVCRFLRHRGSRAYFKDGTWTQDPAEANSFSDVLEVAQTCTRYGLSDVEIAIRYDANSCDLFCTSLR